MGILKGVTTALNVLTAGLLIAGEVKDQRKKKKSGNKKSEKNPAMTQDEIYQALKNLKELFDSGIITEAEYEKKKKPLVKMLK